MSMKLPSQLTKTGGWLHTGDVGYIDDDGDVFVVDRIKELIKYKGLQVAPAELEGVLLTHPSVKDAAVIGLPDEEAGEIPGAWGVISPEAKEIEEDIIKYVAANVAHYKSEKTAVRGRNSKITFRKDNEKAYQGEDGRHLNMKQAAS